LETTHGGRRSRWVLFKMKGRHSTVNKREKGRERWVVMGVIN
jgi:hypothetical protein